VLTLENVYAIKITDYAAIEAAGIERAEVADRLFKAYLKQMFEDRFFHADPHPGNIFVLPLPREHEEQKREWQLVFVDFGMTGRISGQQFAAMREGVMAIGMRDPQRAVKACQMFDVLLPGTDLDLLEKASGRILERLGGKSTLEMMSDHDREVHQLIDEFSDLFYEMPFQAPQNLILLGRCLSILSGIATGLNPEFNPWLSISPYALRLLREEEGGSWEFWLKEMANSLRAAAMLPQKTETLLAHVEQGRLEVRSPELREQLKHVEHSLHRLGVAILFAAFLIGSIQLFLAGFTIIGLALGAAALITLIGFVFSLSFP
jgi:predicted unusual protein kinase regulating ubiquinone biosynthesis (AarF/ABC1/UbiB family)